MPNVLVVTPMATGQEMSDEVLNGLSIQTIPTTIVTHHEPPLNDDIRLRELSINDCRGKLQAKVLLGPPFDYVLLLDSDVVIQSENAIELLIDELDKGSKVALAITKGYASKNHKIAACALIRFDDYAKVDYTLNPIQCQCIKLMQLFGRENIHYVPAIKAYEIK